jgi:hypothetical protein
MPYLVGYVVQGISRPVTTLVDVLLRSPAIAAARCSVSPLRAFANASDGGAAVCPRFLRESTGTCTDHRRVANC